MRPRARNLARGLGHPLQSEKICLRWLTRENVREWNRDPSYGVARLAGLFRGIQNPGSDARVSFET